MTIEDFVLRALRVPFALHGRSYDGWDCWGVVTCGYRDVGGVELPLYVDEYDEADPRDVRLYTLVETAAADGTWRMIDRATEQPRPLDVVVLRILGRPLHVGLMVDKRRMIHCEHRAGTVVEPFESKMWAKRLDGVYRRV